MSQYKAEPCDCGHVGCQHWHVRPVAMMQGVSFTKEQAELMALTLNLGHENMSTMLQLEQQAERLRGQLKEARDRVMYLEKRVQDLTSRY